MALSQVNSLYNYLKQTKISFFLFIKSENRRAEQVLSEVLVAVWKGEEVEKGCGMMNMVEILCTHVCKWKSGTC
jgi:uncharacterized Fe-S cluster-containing MiaB family protein